MKKQILITLILVSSILTINAQTWTGSTDVNGNLWRNGNVGIGLSDPDYRLTVNGYIKVNNTDEAGYLWGNPTNLWNLYKPSGSTDLRLLAYNSWQNVMTFKFDNGNIGIGTTNPLTKLEIAGAITINPATAPENYLLFKTNGTSLGIIGSDGSISGGNNGNMGMYVYGNNNLEFWTNNTKRLVINGAGNLGVGLNNPDYRLTVDGYVKVNNSGEAGYLWGNSTNLWNLYKPSGSNDLILLSYNGFKNIMTFKYDNGYVGIGTSTPGHELDVVGTIRAHEVIVNLDNLGDFVFDPSYKLMALPDIEQYVKLHKHLPEIPSAAEVAENGLNMGDMQNKLLQKVEELTLYTIEQDNKLEQQNAKITELEKQNEKIEKQSNEIEQLKLLVESMVDKK